LAGQQFLSLNELDKETKRLFRLLSYVSTVGWPWPCPLGLVLYSATTWIEIRDQGLAFFHIFGFLVSWLHFETFFLCTEKLKT